MIRLGFSVEGATERAFINRVLAPHLAQFNLDVRAISLDGKVSLDRIRSELPPLLAGFDHVSTMYDFYRFKRRGAHSIDSLQAAIAELVSPEKRRNLTAYVQMHEFEALLFAVPEITVAILKGEEKHLQALHSAVKACGSPEAVNAYPCAQLIRHAW